jgi:isochorismate pyruvate lyase
MATRIPHELLSARSEIDAIDKDLVNLLARRQKVVERVIEIKKLHGLPARMSDRVGEVIDNATRQAEKSGVDTGLVRAFWTLMVDWFVQMEEQQLAIGDN